MNFHGELWNDQIWYFSTANESNYSLVYFQDSCPTPPTNNPSGYVNPLIPQLNLFPSHRMETPPPTPISSTFFDSECASPSQPISIVNENLESDEVRNPERRPKRSNKRCRCTNCESGLNRGPKKTHNCSWKNCEKVFNKTTHLDSHILTHQKVRPFVCKAPNCLRSFTRCDELSRHQRIHESEKRFNCEICSKGFTRSDHYKKHLRIHPITKQNDLESRSNSLYF